MKTIALMAIIITLIAGMTHAADVTFGKAEVIFPRDGVIFPTAEVTFPKDGVQQYLPAKSSFFHHQDTFDSQAGNIITGQDRSDPQSGNIIVGRTDLSLHELNNCRNNKQRETISRQQRLTE